MENRLGSLELHGGSTKETWPSPGKNLTPEIIRTVYLRAPQQVAGSATPQAAIGAPEGRGTPASVPAGATPGILDLEKSDPSWRGSAREL